MLWMVSGEAFLHFTYLLPPILSPSQEPHRVYPSISANLRRPIRVLSLFDGIGTGKLQMGIQKVEEKLLCLAEDIPQEGAVHTEE